MMRAQLNLQYEANIEYALRVLWAHPFEKHYLNGDPKGPPSEQELVDVDALLRWRMDRVFLKTHSAATQRGFMLLNWVRMNRTVRRLASLSKAGRRE